MKKSLLLKTLFTSERRPLFCWWDRVRFLGCEQQDRANLCVPKRVMESCSGGHGIKEKPEKTVSEWAETQKLLGSHYQENP